MGEFYFSAKAFDVLERLEPTPENWLGKRGACVGVFQQVIAGGQSKERLRDVYAMLQTSRYRNAKYLPVITAAINKLRISKT